MQFVSCEMVMVKRCLLDKELGEEKEQQPSGKLRSRRWIINIGNHAHPCEMFVV